jgi:hypothetical protein
MVCCSSSLLPLYRLVLCSGLGPGQSDKKSGRIYFRSFSLYTRSFCWTQWALGPVGWVGSHSLQRPPVCEPQGNKCPCWGAPPVCQRVGGSKQSSEFCIRKLARNPGHVSCWSQYIQAPSSSKPPCGREAAEIKWSVEPRLRALTSSW